MIKTQYQASVESEIRRAEQKRILSLVKGDVAGVAELLASEFQMIDAFGGVVSKVEFLKRISSGNLSYLHWTPDEMVVRVNIDSAIIRYSSTLEVLIDGRIIPSTRYWHTNYYEKHMDMWQCVWSQATRVQNVDPHSSNSVE